MKCAAPFCRRPAKPGRKHCHVHYVGLRASTQSARQANLYWLVEVGIARTLQDAERHWRDIERMRARRGKRPKVREKLEHQPEYDAEAVAIVASYAANAQAGGG